MGPGGGRGGGETSCLPCDTEVCVLDTLCENGDFVLLCDDGTRVPVISPAYT